MRDPTKDVTALEAAENDYVGGIWSDGDTMWVVDSLDAKLYAYNLHDRTYDADRDFNTLNGAGNDSPQGIWSDGDTMWVTDNRDNRVYAYDLATKSPDPDKDFSPSVLQVAWNIAPTGFWSDGETLWVADAGSRNPKLYAYDVTTQNRNPVQDFDNLYAAGNRSPTAIWSDGTTIWVADSREDKLYAYDLATRNRNPPRDLKLGDAGIRSPQGIWSDGTTIWITAGRSFSLKVYAYNLATGNRERPDKDNDGLRESGPNSTPREEYLVRRALRCGSPRNMHQTATRTAWSAMRFMATKNRESHEGCLHPDKGWITLYRSTGLWSYGTTLWVADPRGQGTLMPIGCTQASAVHSRHSAYRGRRNNRRRLWTSWNCTSPDQRPPCTPTTTRLSPGPASRRSRTV